MKYLFAFVCGVFIVAGVEYDAGLFGAAAAAALASVDMIVTGARR